ncbi:MAG TPA: dTMP kinase, partial [archaeon]|nr:dTMP kinase [archaeon]
MVTLEETIEGVYVKRGILISIEGCDGAGKTTHSRRLRDSLVRYGFNAAYTTEPSLSKVGKFIRLNVSRAKKQIPVEVEALLFAADRFEHIKTVVEPALRHGKIVISDRYVHSSLAYQGARMANLDWLRKINVFTLKPDLGIYLDVPPKVGLRRKLKDRTVFENFELQRKVRRIYLKFVERGELTLIDATGDLDKVDADILKV